MGTISQLILADTGCVSYLVYCKKTNEVAIIDSFQGFEKEIEDAIKELKNPKVKYVIDTHTHADRLSASSYFFKKYKTDGIVKSNETKYKSKIQSTNDNDILEVGES